MNSSKQFYRDRYSNLRYKLRNPIRNEPTFQLRINELLKAIDNQQGRVLDFGCNVGYFSEILANLGFDVFGVDISDSAIKIANENVTNAKFQTINSENEFPFPDSYFDICFSSEVIEHLFDVSGFINEANRVLSKNGLFILTTPYHGFIKNVLVTIFNFENHFDPTGGHIRFFSKKSLSKCLNSGGFAIDYIKGLGRTWPIWKSMFVKAHKL